MSAAKICTLGDTTPENAFQFLFDSATEEQRQLSSGGKRNPMERHFHDQTKMRAKVGAGLYGRRRVTGAISRKLRPKGH